MVPIEYLENLKAKDLDGQILFGAWNFRSKQYDDWRRNEGGKMSAKKDTVEERHTAVGVMTRPRENGKSEHVHASSRRRADGGGFGRGETHRRPSQRTLF